MKLKAKYFFGVNWTTREVLSHLSLLPQAAPAHNARSYMFFFYVNLQRNVASGIYYYITTEFDFAKHDSRRLAAVKSCTSVTTV